MAPTEAAADAAPVRNRLNFNPFPLAEARYLARSPDASWLEHLRVDMEPKLAILKPTAL